MATLAKRVRVGQLRERQEFKNNTLVLECSKVQGGRREQDILGHGGKTEPTGVLGRSETVKLNGSL